MNDLFFYPELEIGTAYSPALKTIVILIPLK